MKRFACMLTAVAVLLVFSSVSFAGVNNFTGTWKNVNTRTKGITKLLISVKGRTATIHAWGKCQPKDCDWGTVRARYHMNNSLRTAYKTTIATRSLVLTLKGKNSLHASVKTHYTDKSGREDRRNTYTFKRAATPRKVQKSTLKPVRAGAVTETRVKGTTPSASERAAISAVRNRIRSLHSQVARIKGLVQVHRNSTNKISRLQKQQQNLKIKAGPQELKRVSNISRQSDRWVANSQHASHSVQRESQKLLTGVRQLMIEVRQLQSMVKTTSYTELKQLSVEAAGLVTLTGKVKNELDVKYKGNCWNLPNIAACIECCKSRNKITADPGTQQREFQEAFRSRCIKVCNDIITAREEASTNFEDAKEEQEDILEMLRDLMRQKQEQESAGMRNIN